MVIKEARFIISSPRVNNCPKPVFPEYAFIGRSNVGKSSLINMLTNRKGLARTSKTPGKTQLINHFLINNEWYLVDLPGYGFANIPVSRKKAWDRLIQSYILQRKNLLCLFVLIDSRHRPQKNDLSFMEFLGLNKIPFVIVFTKTDKLTRDGLDHNMALYEKEMLRFWESLPPVFTASSVDRKGREEILDYIEEMNFRFK